MKAFAHGESLGEGSKKQGLTSAQNGEAGKEQGVCVESYAADGYAGKSQGTAEKADGDEEGSREDEQPLRGEEQVKP